MRNSYWVLRHGKSRANEAGVVVSSLENGVKEEYGLSDLGRTQAAEAGRQLAQELGQSAGSIQIYASPFSRTMETAGAVAVQLGMDPSVVTPTESLRERYFGTEMELKSHSMYESVWEGDSKDTDTGPSGGGESVSAVSTRLSQLLDRLEQEHSGCKILLVAHGDTLSILSATMKGTDLHSHREWGLDTAGLSCLAP